MRVVAKVSPLMESLASVVLIRVPVVFIIFENC